VAASRTSLRTFVPPDPPRTPKSARTRQLLLEVSARLFIERGYSAVSLQEIAASSELTTGALYGHFRSKGQLLVEVIRSQVEAADARSDLVDIDIDRGVAMLHSAIRRDLRLLEVDAAAAARHDTEVAAGLQELYRDRLARMQEFLADATDPVAVAWIVFVLNGGIGIAEAIGQPGPTAEGLDEVLATMFAALDPQRPDPRDEGR